MTTVLPNPSDRSWQSRNDESPTSTSNSDFHYNLFRNNAAFSRLQSRNDEDSEIMPPFSDFHNAAFQFLLTDSAESNEFFSSSENPELSSPIEEEIANAEHSCQQRKRAEVWKPTVPSWEKEYCDSVGLPWKEFCKAKEYISCYDSVLNWNNSVGGEAFHVAKERYWAKYNGHSCHLPPPDPDIYIDVIDCNTEQLLDVDFPDRDDSESENLDTEKLPDTAQETLTPFDIKSHATEIQDKERPFGIGYYVSGSCSYTYIFNVVDLYTTEPPLPDHYKLTLVTAGWDSGKGLSKEHSTPSRLMCKEENGWENKKATGWNESEMKGTNFPSHIAMLEKNGAAEYTSWVKPIVSGWGLTT